MSRLRAIGLMSGTSMDGVDAALIETDGEKYVKVIEEASIDYPKEFHHLLKEVERIIRSNNGVFLPDHPLEYSYTIKKIIELSTDYHIQAIKKLHEYATADLIGYHGQTFYHKPEDKISIILGYPERIAQEFRKTVVYNFRENDILHGGKGAPLAPIYHHALAQNYTPCAFVNCGGISNVTFIEQNNLLAFDCGPGNCLIDRFVKIKTNNQMLMDVDGAFASKGVVNEKVLSELWTSSCPSFYESLPPKALDVHDILLPESIFNLSIEDGCLTLAEFTAQTISKSQNFWHTKPNLWILSGGGFYNPILTHLLKQRLSPSIVKRADEMGWHLKTIEAQLFGYLGVRSFKKMPITFPKTTGVPYPLEGGSIINAS